jgi:hypothetical protein
LPKEANFLRATVKKFAKVGEKQFFLGKAACCASSYQFKTPIKGFCNNKIRGESNSKIGETRNTIFKNSTFFCKKLKAGIF